MITTVQNTVYKPALDNFLHHCHIKTYPAKTTLIRIGENNQKLYFIMDGSVTVGTEDEEDGRELIYAYLNAGEFIGEVGIFNETEFRSVNIKTRCRCQLAEISHARLKQLLKTDLSEYAYDLLFMVGKQLSARLLMTSRNFRDLAFMDTEGRIARTLLDLCKEPSAMTHPDGMQIQVTRQELSRIVGCSREVAGRVLKELEIKKMINAHGKTIVVFNAR
ncbi:MAG: cAMP-activated global transcriptional regulator CRP [Methylococcaceae bacterium]|nr:cAMP-activated global transcriptional regulator CRP [Methylococcaceae bacterium]